MNNKIKILYTGIMVAALSLVGFSACSSDFLDEDYITGQSTADFETSE